MHALFDTGSNIALLNKKLAEQLGLIVKQYTSKFKVAYGASARFIGRYLKIRLQLHDFLAIMVESIQIIDGAAEHMSIIL